MFFRCDGEDMSLISIYNKNKKRRAKSKYLLSVMVDVVKDRDIIPAKVVYVRNRNKRKESLCLISTDVNAKATLTWAENAIMDALPALFKTKLQAA